MQLKQGTLLQGGKYKIEGVLGQGGFGITYVAKDTRLGRKVCVKEFFMKEYCNREIDTSYVSVASEGAREQVEKYRAKFIKEARLISSMNNPHIITIFDVFEENGSAYYTMEYLVGGSLKTLVEQNGTLSESAALKYISEIADALAYLHKQKVMHLDVKPSNIMLNSRGEAVLIDFGISKRYDHTGGQTSSTPVGISKGYAPMEQYNLSGVSIFSPETDIYSLGATLYYLVIGIAPKEANVINEDGLGELPKHINKKVRQTITHAMQPRRKDRPSSIEGFMGELALPIEIVDVQSAKNKAVTRSSNNKSKEVYMNSIHYYMMWATYPILWAFYNKREANSFKYWQLCANPVLWLLVILPFLMLIFKGKVSETLFLPTLYGCLALLPIGAITFAMLLNKEIKRLSLKKIHYILDVILAVVTFAFSNIISSILFNIILPAIVGINYLADREFSKVAYRATFRCLAIANTICASLFSLFVFCIFVAVFVFGFDS